MESSICFFLGELDRIPLLRDLLLGALEIFDKEFELLQSVDLPLLVMNQVFLLPLDFLDDGLHVQLDVFSQQLLVVLLELVTDPPKSFLFFLTNVDFRRCHLRFSTASEQETEIFLLRHATSHTSRVAQHAKFAGDL